MCEMSALRQVKAEHLVPRFEERQVNGGVCLRARMRLNVRVLRGEEFLRAVYRQLLDLIYEFAAAVVALTGQTFGVLVGKGCSNRLENRFRHEVLAGNELEAVALPVHFAANDRRDIRITFPDRVQL